MGTLYYDCIHTQDKKIEKFFLSVKAKNENGIKMVQYGSFCKDCKLALERDNKLLLNTKQENDWIFN